MAGQHEVTAAKLVPTLSVTQFVITQLLAGLKVDVTVDGLTVTGRVHSLDFAPESSRYVIALVKLPPLSGDEEGLDVQVAIHTDGHVNVTETQPE